MTRRNVSSKLFGHRSQIIEKILTQDESQERFEFVVFLLEKCLPYTRLFYDDFVGIENNNKMSLGLVKFSFLLERHARTTLKRERFHEYDAFKNFQFIRESKA